MKKKIVIFTVLSCLVSLVPMFLGLLLWDKLPDQMATSFGLDGEIQGYSSKGFAVFGLPLILALANILCIVFTMADPRRKNISGKALAAVLAIIPLCSIFCGALLYGEYLGHRINAETFAPVFLGVVFVIVGRILPKCKQNYTVGIRLPWTLHSEENWNKTHAFGGRLWVIGGIVMTILGLLGYAIAVMLGIFVLAFVPMLYSYVYYRKKEIVNTYISISQTAAKKIMDTEKSFVIIDARTQEEYEKGHIEGAIMIPEYEITEKAAQLLPNKNEQILVYCRSGKRSKIASQALADLGYTQVKEFGGIMDWQYEIVK